MSARRPPIALASLLALCLLVAPGGARADETPKVPLETANLELGVLEDRLGSARSFSEDIIGSLDAVANAYVNPQPPEAPPLQEAPADASEEVRAAVEEANQKTLREHERVVGEYERELEKFRRGAEKAFLKALKLVRVKGEGTNLRDDVNVRAAQILGQTGNPKLGDDIVKTLENTIFKAKHQVPQALYDECFAALPRLGYLDGLEWMGKEFTHSKMSPREVVDQLMAAHKAMVLYPYEQVPGKLRHYVVSQMVKTYSGVESQARQTSNDKNVQAAKAFWDRIKTDAIKVLQHYAGQPQNADGELLATMEEFQAWFRANDNVRRPPWSD